MSFVETGAVGVSHSLRRGVSVFLSLLSQYIMRIWYGSRMPIFRILSLGTRWKRTAIFTPRLVSGGDRTDGSEWIDTMFSTPVHCAFIKERWSPVQHMPLPAHVSCHPRVILLAPPSVPQLWRSVFLEILYCISDTSHSQARTRAQMRGLTFSPPRCPKFKFPVRLVHKFWLRMLRKIVNALPPSSGSSSPREWTAWPRR